MTINRWLLRSEFAVRWAGRNLQPLFVERSYEADFDSDAVRRNARRQIARRWPFHDLTFPIFLGPLARKRIGR